MKIKYLALFLILSNIMNAQPISKHPKNPHYFIYKNKPLVLISSAEHYGAVINIEFDYVKYLNTLHAEGMNYTRVFSGAYVEKPGVFNMEKNTLAPETGCYLAPWKRVSEKSLYDGENKFDLSTWNPDYFQRLKNFLALAEKLDIIVEITFFSSIYNEENWQRNPFNPGNNVNNFPEIKHWENSNLPGNKTVNKFQQKLVEKIVGEVNSFDNVIFEIQNEPWTDNPDKDIRLLKTLDAEPEKDRWFKYTQTTSKASLEWQKQLANAIIKTEEKLPKKHLIAQNYVNFKHAISNVDNHISVINFHYAWPEAAWMNYGWERPLSYDESGFDGSSDTTYLRQAWQFILAGGAVFNNLDYSFFVGKEDGTGKNSAPGGGSALLRKQLQYLASFINSIDFLKTSPDFNVVYHSPGLEWQALSQHGKQYAMVFTGHSAGWVKLSLPENDYSYEFICPFTGKVVKKGTINKSDIKSSAFQLDFPEFDTMVALKIIEKL